VDGYNASIRTWPGTPIAEQRDRLVSAVAELAARTGVRVVVAFDGADHTASVAGSHARAAVQVRFSRAGQQADDLILDLLDATPVDTPVLVASDDQRVRREAAARGANVLTQSQLFWLLRRER
jgi:predicted RNA-binding protein with PIN domain